MIETVLDVLRRLDLLSSEQEPPWNAFVHRNLHYEVFVGARVFYYVKVGQRALLAEEYRGLKRAMAAMPENVAKPLSLTERDGVHLLVCEGVKHLPLRRDELLELGPSAARNLSTYFDRAQASFRCTQDAPPHADLLVRIAEAYPGERFVQKLEEWAKAGGTEFLSPLAHVNQHGDFAVNNLGQRSGTIVIFDWEDFGKVHLPGFDLCILLASLLEFDHEKLVTFLDNLDGSPWLPLLSHVWALSNMDAKSFRRLLPMFLAAFLYVNRADDCLVTVKGKVKKLILAL